MTDDRENLLHEPTTPTTVTVLYLTPDGRNNQHELLLAELNPDARASAQFFAGTQPIWLTSYEFDRDTGDIVGRFPRHAHLTRPQLEAALGTMKQEYDEVESLAQSAIVVTAQGVAENQWSSLKLGRLVLPADLGIEAYDDAKALIRYAGGNRQLHLVSRHFDFHSGETVEIEQRLPTLEKSEIENGLRRMAFSTTMASNDETLFKAEMLEERGQMITVSAQHEDGHRRLRRVVATADLTDAAHLAAAELADTKDATGAIRLQRFEAINRAVTQPATDDGPPVRQFQPVLQPRDVALSSLTMQEINHWLPETARSRAQATWAAQTMVEFDQALKQTAGADLSP